MTDRRRFSSARTEDSYNYSDDFSEDDIAPVKSAPEKQRTREFTYASEAHSFLRSGGRGRNQGKGRGRGRGQGRNSQARSDTHVDVVTKRLLSANRLKVNELQNQVEDMRKQMKLVTDENKLFKRMQHKQEKALVKFEDRESELPQMIQAHNNEVRSLREQLRRTRDKYEKTDRYLRDAEDELERVNTKCQKYKSLSDQKDLAERSDLDRRLNKSELAIEEKECRIRELERHMENLKKNHRHELGIERARYKETQRQLDEIKETNSKLETVLREKEKQLDAQNIYSNRLGKPSSYSGTPAGSPAPWRQSLKKKSESMSDLAARDKARAYEERRKGQGTKKKEKLRLPKLPLSPKKPVEKPARSQEPKQKWEEESREKDEESATTAATASSEMPNFTFSSLQRQDSDADFWRRQEERFRQDKDNRQKQETERKKKEEEQEQEEQARFQQQRDKFRRDMEERERRERERREADEREQEQQQRRHQQEQQREREERERKEKEKEAAKKREAEQRERQRKENERRVQEERDRLDNDPHVAEERQKKDELLRRLQQLDGNRDGSQPSTTSDPFAPSEPTPKRTAAAGGAAGDQQTSDPFAVSPSRRADPFGGDSSFSSPSSKKDYAFPRSIENMHKGKPAHEDVSVPYIDRQKKGRASKEDEGIGGYQPSFTSPTKGEGKKKTLSLFDDDEEEVKPAASKPDPGKKNKLMADLFGAHLSSSSTSTSAKKDAGEDFFLTSKSPPAQKPAPAKKPSSGFPWDDSPSHGKTNGTTSHRESATLFGGGAALVDDDLSGGGSGSRSTMLPKRSRQATTTFNSKPAMVAVDNLEDDIEEVVL